MSESKRSLKAKAIHGMREYFIIFVYLWIIFTLLVAYRAVILSQHDIEFVPNGFALLNALALAKVILIAQELHLADNFRSAPLIYPAILKSFVFSILLTCFKILEEIARDMYHGSSFSASIGNIVNGSWTSIAASAALLFVVLIPFFGFSELRSVLGEERLLGAFFRGRHLLK
jgi:hypothetical protein